MILCLCRWLNILGAVTVTVTLTVTMIITRDNSHMTARLSNQKPPITCLLTPRNVNLHYGRWHVHIDDTSHLGDLLKISVYTAFYDDRPDINAGPTVRVFGVSSARKDRMVYCQIWLSDAKHPHVVPADITVIGRGAHFKGVKYYEYLYVCPVTISHSIPKYISLAFQVCDQSTVFLPVIQPKILNSTGNVTSHQHGSPPFLHEFGICVAVAYNDIDPLRIVEWVEFNKLLGVTEINIYNSSVSKRAMSIFEHYAREGIVTIHSAPPPIPSQEYWPRKLAVIPAFNDCLYKNMYRYKYMVVKDLDELIIPRKHKTYKEMFADILPAHKERTPFPAYQFRNSYFFLDLPQDSKQPSYLMTIRERNRLAPSKPGYSVKTISDPRHCVVMSNHYCLVKSPTVVHHWTLPVKPEFAMNQHYKACHFSSSQCNILNKEYVHDDTTLRYKEELEKGVLKQLEMLNLI